MTAMHGHAIRTAAGADGIPPPPDLVDELLVWSASLKDHFGREGSAAAQLVDRAVREIERLRASADATRPNTSSMEAH
jgi:hypothetical protein